MIPTGTAAIAFTVIVATLIGYLFAARRGQRKDINHPDDFFLARQRMTGDDLGDTQIAYALQMSTVYPFFVLAFSGVWLVPILNALFWLIGIALFMLWIPRFKPFLGNSNTIHAFISHVNVSPPLRRLASTMSVIAFSGVIIFELVFGASVFRVLFGDDRVVYYVIITFLAIYLMAYIWNGGQTATLRTEQLQLLIAYMGLHFSVSHMFLSAEVDQHAIVPVFIPIIVLVYSVIMLVSRILSLVRAARDGRRLITGAYIVMILSLSTVIFSISLAIPKFNFSHAFAPVADSGSTTRLDLIMLIGTAVLLPVFWQFVDLSNWQRICALAAVTPEEYTAQAKRGILEYLIESPLSWILAVLLGIAAPHFITKIAGGPEDPFEAFLYRFLAEPGMGQIVGICLVAGIVGVFMSTADAAITAIGYACAYDLWRPTQKLMDVGIFSATDTAKVVAVGRWCMAIAVAGVLICFVLFDWAFRAGQTFIGLLFAFYTPLICLSPAVLCPVWFGYRPSGGIVFAAIVAGTSAGLGLGFYSVLAAPDMQWYPAPIAFITSWVIYIFGLFATGTKLSKAETRGWESSQ